MKLALALSATLFTSFNMSVDHPLISLLNSIQSLACSKEGFSCELFLISDHGFEEAQEVLSSLKALKLQMSRAIFTGGDGLDSYLKTFEIDLFLTSDTKECRAAEGICAAAILLQESLQHIKKEKTSIRFAFDADAVLFNKASEEMFQKLGRDAFFEHEERQATTLLAPGPFAPLYRKLHHIKELLSDKMQLQTAIVTARGMPAEQRVIHSLLCWGCIPDALFILDGTQKHKALNAYRADIFFDDKLYNLLSDKTDAVLGHVVT